MPGGGVVRAPKAWLAEYVALPDELSAEDLGEALVRVGLEVERVESGADAMSGPIVVGRVLAFEEEPQKNGKTIRWCQVDVGSHNEAGQPRGIVCGARNFAVDDLVVVSLPGAVLPGGFAISARKTYGHVSDGMICSARELGLGEDHDGILILTPDAGAPGDDALDVLGLRAAVLEISVTPDRGYCLSIRGLAREAGTSLGVEHTDVADTVTVPAIDGGAYDVRVEDPAGCPQFAMRRITGLDPAAPTPDHIRERLTQVGMRPISLAVDVTNYVMLETGQPLHAFDAATVAGPIVVRRATAGEKLTTLDDKARTLDVEDLLVTDDSGPIALAGVMGGASTEIGEATDEVLLEAATWNPTAIARTVRRHRRPSEAAKRFERGVDPNIAAVALQRCVDLLVEHGGASAAEGFTVVGRVDPPPTIALPVSLPSRLGGLTITPEHVALRLRQVGCAVAGTDPLAVTPPSWRPDLTMPAELVEEVLRLEGYEKIPSVLPTPPAGRGLTERQKLMRSISRAVAAAGYVEVLDYPWVSPEVHDAFGLLADDERRAALRVANPLNEAEPELRTSLLPGLLGALLRNVGRGARDLSLFEMGLVYLPGDGAAAPEPGAAGRPGDADLVAMDAALPRQPRHLAVVLCGDRVPAGWWGPARPATWADAVEAAQVAASAARVELTSRAADHAPWHPGRCAELLLADRVVGYAGELHPRVIATLGLPERSCAMELDLDAFEVPPPAPTPTLSSFPPVLLDVALVVPSTTASADVEAALAAGAGELLESVRLFDVYSDAERIGADRKSLAFALRFRAPDRTLTVEEANAARDAAIAAATERTGATLRT